MWRKKQHTWASETAERRFDRGRKKVPTKHSKNWEKRHWTIVFQKLIYSVAEQIDFYLVSNSVCKIHTRTGGTRTHIHWTLTIKCTNTIAHIQFSFFYCCWLDLSLVFTFYTFVCVLKKMQILGEQMFMWTKRLERSKNKTKEWNACN